VAGASAISWVSKRIGVFVDAFSKEAGKDSYIALKGLVSHFRAENKHAASAAEAMAGAQASASKVQGQFVQVRLAINSGDMSFVVSSPQTFSTEEAILAFFMMANAIEAAAKRIVEQQRPAFSELTASVLPEGFSLRWTDDRSGQMVQHFSPDGQVLSEAVEGQNEASLSVLLFRD
jgi:YD repeat-containing protein